MDAIKGKEFRLIPSTGEERYGCRELSCKLDNKHMLFYSTYLSAYLSIREGFPIYFHYQMLNGTGTDKIRQSYVKISI